MRTVTYGAACSLDGFITGKDEDVGWLHHSSNVNAIMREYWESIDTVLMGRKTWEFAIRMGGGGGTPGVRTYVFSSTIKSIGAKGVELIRGDAGAFVADLKTRPGKGICVLGGGELAASLLAAGVIDEVGMNVHPVLLGGGVPFFVDAGRRTHLELLQSRVIDGGCVYSLYRVRPAH